MPRLLRSASIATSAAGLLALLVLIAVGLLALSPPYAGLDDGIQLTPTSMQSVVRTYLLRLAVFNTLALVLATSALSLLLARLWGRVGIGQSGRSLYLLPLLLPGAAAGLLWEPILAESLALSNARLNLLLTGLVVVWRAAPAAALLLATLPRAWLPAACIAPLLVLTDAGLVLMLTGGEPFNAAQTWPSWLLLTLWTHGSWGHGAVIGIGLALATTVAAGAAGLGLPPASDRTEAEDDTPPRHGWLGLELVGVWSLGPFIPAIVRFVAGPWVALQVLWAMGLLNWIGLWLVLAGVVGVATAWLMRAWTERNAAPRLGGVLMALAVGWLPLWTVALAYLRHALPGLGGVWTLVLLLTFTGAGLGVGLALRLGAARRRYARLRNGMALALLLLPHSFSLVLVLDLPLAATLPAVGTAMGLAHAAPSALAGALLVQGILAWGAAWAVLRTGLCHAARRAHTRNPV